MSVPAATSAHPVRVPAVAWLLAAAALAVVFARVRQNGTALGVEIEDKGLEIRLGCG
jgi:hypothetical protein